MSQITLTSDPLGSATTGTLEFENPAFYLTGAASQRGVVLADQYLLQQATYTLTNTTSAQKLFGVTTNGAVTLVPGTYEFDCVFSLSSMAASGSFGFAFGGAATITQYWWSSAVKANPLATAVAAQVTYNTAASTAIATASASTTGFARCGGVVIVSVGGTLIPQVSLGTGAAAVVGIGSYFKIRALGGAAATSSGNWS